MHQSVGQIALLGSGETSLSGGRIFEMVAQKLPKPVHISLLETPAGFELNSSQIATRVGDFLKIRLQNFDPVIDVIPARKQGTFFNLEDETILQPLIEADIIFLGPGSPSYAVRQLRGSLAWDLVRARHRLGAALVFSSAAVVAISEYSLPVYEIYKVGEDVHIAQGLGLCADFGLLVSFVPHWNNTDGGAELDTSRCFVGMDRFNQWCKMLPPGHTIVGLDEHTDLIIDIMAGNCTVSGISSVTLMREQNSVIFPAGKVFPTKELGEVHCPELLKKGIRSAVWEMIANTVQTQEKEIVPLQVSRLVEERNQARLCSDWATADILRQQIETLGWIIRDTPEGQKIVRQL